ncbi:50S ribosomal protein L14 [Striga asiatica]|uniref:50S ribosomal protein L14 n=1 Tax=Striga asiatica TaxID=4170 RepID=A0A5A7Q4B3_STRAF|nr:50S ribosomal protein L14 [Striga asiatica]
MRICLTTYSAVTGSTTATPTRLCQSFSTSTVAPVDRYRGTARRFPDAGAGTAVTSANFQGTSGWIRTVDALSPTIQKIRRSLLLTKKRYIRNRSAHGVGHVQYKDDDSLVDEKEEERGEEMGHVKSDEEEKREKKREMTGKT